MLLILTNKMLLKIEVTSSLEDFLLSLHWILLIQIFFEVHGGRIWERFIRGTSGATFFASTGILNLVQTTLTLAVQGQYILVQIKLTILVFKYNCIQSWI